MCVRIHIDLINADNYTVLGKDGSEKIIITCRFRYNDGQQHVNNKLERLKLASWYSPSETAANDKAESPTYG